MKWYISKIIFQVICGTGEHGLQFDEQFRLIQAENEREALEKATAVGREEEDSFNNQQNEVVVWRFFAVTELEQIRDLKDKAEIYSRIVEPEDEDRYRALMRLRAERVRNYGKLSII